MHLPRLFSLLALTLIGCTAGDGGAAAQSRDRPFQIEALASFDEPWAMTFLPSGQALITEKRGHLKLWTPGRPAIDVAAVPPVHYSGQGGLADIVLHPNYARNHLVYLSYAEPGPGDASGGAVARATLSIGNDGARLDNFQVIWRQTPRMDGEQYGLRIAFGPDHLLYVSGGERQHFDPAQDMTGNLGKIVRLNDDGTRPRAILSPRRAALPRRSGAWVTATRSGSPSPLTAISGRTRWARAAATRST